MSVAKGLTMAETIWLSFTEKLLIDPGGFKCILWGGGYLHPPSNKVSPPPKKKYF